MKVTNYSSVVHGNKPDYINLNGLSPVWPFRMLCIGGSDSGKSNAILDLVLNHVYFDKIYVYAKDLEEDIYVFLQSVLEEGIEGNKLKEYHMSTEIDDKLNLDEFGDEHSAEQILIIFDDFINEKASEQKAIRELFCRGRKKGISTIYISQSFMDISPMIRKNAKYIMLYKLADDAAAKTIIRRFSGMKNVEKSFEIYHKCIEEPFNFCLLDKKTKIECMKIRKNWDEFIV